MNVNVGYVLSSEEHRPEELIWYAHRAEEAGFRFATISDHYFPWTNTQGQSAFVWSVIGGISQVTEEITICTGVTCPTFRIHPAIIAQAAATSACLLPGRFYLGVGSGEYLNEHVTSVNWPEAAVRLERLEEAIGIMRELWSGEYVNHHGKYFDVDTARIFSLPEQPPPIIVAAAGPTSTELANRLGDGLMTASPERKLVEHFVNNNGGAQKARVTQLKVCWAHTEEEAAKTAHQWWPNAGTPGPLNSELKTPELFEAVASLVTQQQVRQSMVLGPNPKPYADAIRECADMGYDHVVLHNVGPEQEAFLDFYEREVAPLLDQAA